MIINENNKGVCWYIRKDITNILKINNDSFTDYYVTKSIQKLFEYSIENDYWLSMYETTEYNQLLFKILNGIFENYLELCYRSDNLVIDGEAGTADLIRGIDNIYYDSGSYFFNKSITTLKFCNSNKDILAKIKTGKEEYQFCLLKKHDGYYQYTGKNHIAPFGLYNL